MLRRSERDIITMCIGLLHVKCRLFLTDSKKNLKFVDRYSKNTEMSNFLKIRPSGAELLFVDG